MNAVDYEFWVSGKTPYSWPTTIPITFELMVLLSAFVAVFGMFVHEPPAALPPPDLQAQLDLAASPTTGSSCRSRRATRSSTARRPSDVPREHRRQANVEILEDD